jgi:uncharacterized protein involved in type VI secretion and phage assembly
MEHLEQAGPAMQRDGLYGVYPAIVVDVCDPEGLGRARVRLPWLPDGDGYEVWGRIATLMAGNNRGSWFIPDVGDEVLVAFEFGDPRRPCVVGALWNSVDRPPEAMDPAGDNAVKSIRSRNGVKITLVDQAGEERLLLETPGGQSLTIQDGPGRVEIRDSNGNAVTLHGSGIDLLSSSKITVQASTVEVSAGAVTVNAGLTKFSGVVQCDTLISNAVVSASYTPGAGNLW